MFLSTVFLNAVIMRYLLGVEAGEENDKKVAETEVKCGGKHHK